MIDHFGEEPLNLQCQVFRSGQKTISKSAEEKEDDKGVAGEIVAALPQQLGLLFERGPKNDNVVKATDSQRLWMNIHFHAAHILMSPVVQ